MSQSTNPMIQTAITASELGQDTDSVVAAAKWLMENFPDEKRLLSLTSKFQFENNPVFAKLKKRYGFAISTRNKLPDTFFDGVVLADFVHGKEIFRIPRDQVKAVAVVPGRVLLDRKSGKYVNTSGLQPWAIGTNAGIIGGDSINWGTSDLLFESYKQQVITPLTGVAREIVDGMTQMIYGSMTVDDMRDKDKVVGPLLGLKKHLGHLDRNAIEAFLWSTDWSSSNIEKTLEFIDKINDGKSLKIRGRTIQPVDYSGRF